MYYSLFIFRFISSHLWWHCLQGPWHGNKLTTVFGLFSPASFSSVFPDYLLSSMYQIPIVDIENGVAQTVGVLSSTVLEARSSTSRCCRVTVPLEPEGRACYGHANCYWFATVCMELLGWQLQSLSLSHYSLYLSEFSGSIKGSSPDEPRSWRQSHQPPVQRSCVMFTSATISLFLFVTQEMETYLSFIYVCFVHLKFLCTLHLFYNNVFQIGGKYKYVPASNSKPVSLLGG